MYHKQNEESCEVEFSWQFTDVFANMNAQRSLGFQVSSVYWRQRHRTEKHLSTLYIQLASKDKKNLPVSTVFTPQKQIWPESLRIVFFLKCFWNWSTKCLVSIWVLPARLPRKLLITNCAFSGRQAFSKKNWEANDTWWKPIENFSESGTNSLFWDGVYSTILYNQDEP